MFIRALYLSVLFAFWAGIALPQSTPTTCATGAVNPPVRAEGIAEQLGDIIINCSGPPGSVLTINLAIFLNVGVTNRISTTGFTDALLTIDTGSGPVPAGVSGALQSSNAVSFTGVTFTIPAGKTVNLRVTNLRGNVSQIGIGAAQQIQAVLSLNG